MFTGIIEEVGSIQQIRMGTASCILSVQAEKVLEDVHIGDSIAVNGVCLTVCKADAKHFEADVMPETMRRTNLGSLSPGSRVNLERAMAANGRFGGHIVAGHIDGTGTITQFKREDNAVWVTVSAGAELLRYIVEKGSIAMDGISLTVARVSADSFAVSVIPHTGAETTLLSRSPGDRINLECDMLAKYVEKLCQPKESEKSSKLTTGFLAEHGFL